MRLTRLQLLDIRNFEQLEVTLPEGVCAFIGDNAQGKTNLLEAVNYLTLGRSHRVSSDQALIRAGAQAGVIRAEALTDGGQRIEVSVELRPGRNRAQVNGQPQQRLSDAFGHIRSVMLAPEDLTLVRGDPGDRRRFLDDLLAGRRASFHGVRADLDRALAQRNALLKDARARGGQLATDSFEVWTETYANLAGSVLAARIAAVNALADPVMDAYADLVSHSPPSDVDRLPVVGYELSSGRSLQGTTGQPVPDPAALAQELRQALVERHDEELRRGVTLVGPHRDELFLGIGQLPAKGYASHGEQWSLALALKLATHRVIAEVGDEPVLLLDDVFADLDGHRRERLAARCETFPQVLVTAATGTEVPVSGMRFTVAGGTVRRPDRPAPGGG